MHLSEWLSSNSGSFIIYGAQVVAYGAYKAILGLYQRQPDCFAVSSRKNNPGAIEGVPVRTPEALPRELPVLVCVTELLQEEILAELQRKGFRNVFVLTQHEEHLLMSAYFRSIDRFPVARETAGNSAHRDDFVMYEVKNHRDVPLQSPPGLQPFEVTIQAGAALTKERIGELADDTGENISDKNRQYCELSATYWIWKHTDHGWTGIEHYRRHLLVKPEMLGSGVDAILPLPYICYPDTMTQFSRFASGDVKQALFRALKALHPREYERYRSILYGPYQYTYNLLCARREVFRDYCRWFFEITEYMEAMAGEVPEIKTTRALSYVAEVLTSLYFMDNSKSWNILHTEKGIYV